MLTVMKLPTQKGEHLCKCTELSLKRKEGARGNSDLVIYAIRTLLMPFRFGNLRNTNSPDAVPIW